MKSIITITVRLKSSRLKRKALKDICGKPMLVHLIERLKQSKLAEEIVMCTSTNPEDDDLIPYAKDAGIKYIRGSENDVLSRLYSAAIENDADFIVSCTGDNPLTDPIYADKLIEKFKDTGADYITALDLPWGTFSYGVKVSAIKKVLELKKEEDTEVWGQYFVKSNLFKADKLEIEDYLKHPELRLTVDTPEDFELMTKIYEELYPNNQNFSLKDVVKLLEEDKPELKEINMDIKQKTPKSISNTNLVNAAEALVISSEVIKENFEQMKNEEKLGIVFNEDPQMFFISLPKNFKGDSEVHEDEDDLYIVLEGEADLKIDDSAQKIKKGDLIYIPAKKTHQIIYTEKGIDYIVFKVKNET